MPVQVWRLPPGAMDGAQGSPITSSTNRQQPCKTCLAWSQGQGPALPVLVEWGGGDRGGGGEQIRSDGSLPD